MLAATVKPAPMTGSPVLLAVARGVTRLTLNRPQAGNAMTPQLTAVLREHAAALAARDDVRVVVLAAAGKVFCVGGDLGWMAEQGDDVGPALHAMATDLHAAIELLAACDARPS